MKALADDMDRSDENVGEPSRYETKQSHILKVLLRTLRGKRKSSLREKYARFSPRATLIAMICAILLMDAVLPLRDLWFHEALLTQMGWWPVIPSLLLFPGWDVIPPIPSNTLTGLPDLVLSWEALAMLLGAFVAVFLVYIFAVRYLPGRISRRFIMRSTLVLALVFMLIPIVTSPDIYSYIAYARIGIMHGQNPLTTLPQIIKTDEIYNYVSWVDQPSAYGPTWTLLTCFFQLITALCFLGNFLLAMLLMLRTWGLLMHLGSVVLTWSIAGSLQRLYGTVSHRQRLRATLAFAWNPLLLLEACSNAHNDTTLLFLILLAIWFLVRAQIEPDAPTLPRWMFRLAARFSSGTRSCLLYLAPAGLMALVICLKINLVVLVPGLFFYQWLQTTGQPTRQRLKRVGASVAICVGLIFALYAPFWQGGELLNIFSVNPATSRTINSLANAFAHLYNELATTFDFPRIPLIGSTSEQFARTLSIGLFILCYIILSWKALRNPAFMRTIYGLISWMAIIWLLYCALGSPWFWPWYLVTFFGLYALIEATKPAQISIDRGFQYLPEKSACLTHPFKAFQGLLLHSGVVRLLILSMLTLYCFTTWGPQHTSVLDFSGFQWSYLSGFWAWLLPLSGLLFAPSLSPSQVPAKK